MRPLYRISNEHPRHAGSNLLRTGIVPIAADMSHSASVAIVTARCQYRLLPSPVTAQSTGELLEGLSPPLQCCKLLTMHHQPTALDAMSNMTRNGPASPPGPREETTSVKQNPFSPE